MDQIRLSAKTLNLYRDCPRCFWLTVVKKIERPTGPMATIMSGLDLVIKAYYDQFRGKDELPPIIAGRVPGRLYREVPPWLAMGDPKTNTKLVGKLDELLEPEPGLVAPIDHKSRGKRAEGIHHAYQMQMDIYDLLLGVGGFKTPHKAWLVYYIPNIMNDDQFTFTVDVKEVVTDPDRARDVFMNAAAAARGPEPDSNSECIFCKWFDLRKETFDLAVFDEEKGPEDVPF